MMRIIRIALAWLLILAVSTPAIAGDLRDSIAKAADEQTQTAARRGPMPKPYLWAGTSLFVGGMAVGLYGYLNNKNGEFPEFGEATSTNKSLGMAGLLTAVFRGGGPFLFWGGGGAGRPVPPRP